MLIVLIIGVNWILVLMQHWQSWQRQIQSLRFKHHSEWLGHQTLNQWSSDQNMARRLRCRLQNNLPKHKNGHSSKPYYHRPILLPRQKLPQSNICTLHFWCLIQTHTEVHMMLAAPPCTLLAVIQGHAEMLHFQGCSCFLHKERPCWCHFAGKLMAAAHIQVALFHQFPVCWMDFQRR
jgi:hypothetical protein